MPFEELYTGFWIETILSGFRDKFGDRIYSYKIMSKHPEEEVRSYCMNKLKPCFKKKDMPHAFSPQLIEFKNITNLDNEMGDMYSFKVKHHSTA